MQLTRRQLLLLVFLTFAWGLNWPVMKIGVTHFPPLTFRALSTLLGLPVLALIMLVRKTSFVIPRDKYRELFWLGLTNLVIWNVLIILSVKYLSSGRAAILGYTMPIFSALLGAWFFGARMHARNWLGVAAAALGVMLLLWYELTHLSGRPLAVLAALVAAAFWALGTQKMRRCTIPAATLALSFWMILMAAIVLMLLSLVFERGQWAAPSALTWAAIGYNAVLIFGVAQVVWLTLARDLPPIASTLSIMMIPVLGVFSGALGLGEVLHWQDWAAVGLVMVAIISVLAPSKA